MKIRRDIVQGTPEWRAARIGRVTASEVHRLITPAKLDRSKSRDGYMHELAAERVLGAPCDESTDGWRQRGIEMEAEARDWFSLVYEDVEQVGFIEHDALAVGCSPDGIVEGKFGLECKCPAAKTHAGYVARAASLEEDYRLQPQLSLWLTGWPLWYLVSYCPGMRRVVREVRPDEACFRAFDLWVPALCADVDELARMLVATP